MIVKAELQLYEVQYANAQAQFMKAIKMIREDDLEREDAVEAMTSHEDAQEVGTMSSGRGGETSASKKGGKDERWC